MAPMESVSTTIAEPSRYNALAEVSIAHSRVPGENTVRNIERCIISDVLHLQSSRPHRPVPVANFELHDVESMSVPGYSALLEQVTVIVVTYNSEHCMRRLATGLRNLPNVIVVDNASQDQTIQAVNSVLPEATLITLSANKGYGAANNIALARVRTPYALLLNPDCVVLESDIVALVTGGKEWPQATLLVPQLLDARGNMQLNYSWPRRFWVPRTGPAQGPLAVGYACAATMLVNMAALQPVGFFDERFFLYYEDEDLCLRVFQRHGQILVLPSVRITHLSRGSVRGPRPSRTEYLRGYHHVQSKIFFIRKHAGTRAASTARARVMLSAGFVVLVRLLTFSPRLLARAWGRLVGILTLPP